MRSESEYREALALVDSGLNDSQIGRKLDIPRSTVRDWRQGARLRGPLRTRATSDTGVPGARGRMGIPCEQTCASPDQVLADRESYFYLLGQYLGDGSISGHARGVFRLRVACSWDYPAVMAEVADAMMIVTRKGNVSAVEATGCSYVSIYWKHWPCVFPQHGPGPKHARTIELESWQEPNRRSDREALVRGLIHSDGCRFVNTVTRKGATGVRRYRYPRYVFTNASDDIRDILCRSLDTLAVDWTRMNARNVSIARRESVLRLDEFVGPKG